MRYNREIKRSMKREGENESQREAGLIGKKGRKRKMKEESRHFGG